MSQELMSAVAPGCLDLRKISFGMRDKKENSSSYWLTTWRVKVL